MEHFQDAETFIEYLLWYRNQSQSWNIHNPNKNVYTLRLIFYIHLQYEVHVISVDT